MFSCCSMRCAARYLGAGVVLALLLAPAAATAERGADPRLPAPVARWLAFEQERNDRSNDARRLYPLDNHQDPRYAPEQRRFFQLKSYWVDAERMHAFPTDELAGTLRPMFLRQQNGRAQVRLVVHPESEPLYARLVAGAERAEDFTASATASSRTLISWAPGHPETPFFLKVSLDKMLNGARRTISQGEIARSAGIGLLLEADRAGRVARPGAAAALPASFAALPEVLTAIPRGMPEGGMIIRLIPEGVIAGRTQCMPLFALHSPGPNGAMPALVEMIRRSGQPAETFIRERVIAPCVRQWIELSVKNGITSEPHGQNVLLELDARGLPTGTVVNRDFGGFWVDFEHRGRLGLWLPERMPVIGTLAEDYKLNPGRDRLANLETYFYGGFVHNLDREVRSWFRRGWLEGQAPAERAFERVMLREVERVGAELAGGRVEVNRLDGLTSVLQQVKAAYVRRQGQAR
ncbi:MAG: hypothetical protein IT371_29435 [Deltaproteobacteria bacterium]|nr:hypothetical protein [Deltaproteobacteria bacterium]